MDSTGPARPPSTIPGPTRAALPFPSESILGFTINRVSIQDLTLAVRQYVLGGQKAIIGNHNLHSLYLGLHDGSMQDFYRRCSLVHVDGMAIIFISRLLGRTLAAKHRVTYVDWIHPLASMIESEGWRMFYLGSRPGVAELGLEVLRRSYPNLYASSHHGYFDIRPQSADNYHVLEQIRTFDPDVLFVGMGMPRQERWVVENFEQLDARVILTSGACIDYVAGAVPTPPRWMGQIGLEWLYRLVSDPRRLWKRYLVEPFHLMPLLAKEWRETRQRRPENKRRDT